MWCPECKMEFSEEAEVCPLCGAALEERPEDEEGPQAVFLMGFRDFSELETVVERLRQAKIPHITREPEDEDGDYDLYVDRCHSHRALRLLRQYDRDPGQPFDEDVLTRLAARYEGEEIGEADEPASPEGYKLVWFFLAVFVGLPLLAVALRLLKSLLLWWLHG